MLAWWQSSSHGTDQDGKSDSCILHADRELVLWPRGARGWMGKVTPLVLAQRTNRWGICELRSGRTAQKPSNVGSKHAWTTAATVSHKKDGAKIRGPSNWFQDKIRKQLLTRISPLRWHKARFHNPKESTWSIPAWHYDSPSRHWQQIRVLKEVGLVPPSRGAAFPPYRRAHCASPRHGKDGLFSVLSSLVLIVVSFIPQTLL